MKNNKTSTDSALGLILWATIVPFILLVTGVVAFGNWCKNKIKSRK